VPIRQRSRGFDPAASHSTSWRFEVTGSPLDLGGADMDVWRSYESCECR
jgi:hypothetical protein